MSFLRLPHELRDQIYRELLVTDETLDIMILLKTQPPATVLNPRRSSEIDLKLLNTCHQIREEALVILSKSNRFSIYDDCLPHLEKLFGNADYQMLRDPLRSHRLRVGQQSGLNSLRIRHLHIDIRSATPDIESSHRLMLCALIALAHEADGKGFAPTQPDQWKSSLVAYTTAAILPPADQIRTITIDVGGFWRSESRQLLLDAVSRLYALGNVAFRFQLNGGCEEDMLFGRRAIDRSLLEQWLSKSFGRQIVVPTHDFLPPSGANRSVQALCH